jgi:GNAT superfamily N-acetyltransferase
VDASFVDSLEFRKARLTDAKKVTHLVRELAGDASEAQIRRRFRRLVLRPGYLVYLFLQDGKPVAMWIGREGYFLGADLPYLQMLGMVVAPDLQRRGLGTLLVSRALQNIFPETDYCQVWFITQHEHLHSFYERLGFEKTGVRFVLHRSGAGRSPIARRLARRLGI